MNDPFQGVIKNLLFQNFSGEVKINTLDPIFKTKAGDKLEPPKSFQPLIRHLSYPLTMVLMRTPITPNQITTLGMVFGVSAGFMCLKGDYLSILIGAFLFLICYILDNCDGEIARIKDMRSIFGMRYDTFVDWVVHAVFFICLGWGAHAVTGQKIWFWSGVVAGFGGTVNYVIELYQNRTKPHSTQLTAEEVAIKNDDTKMDRFVLNARVIRSDFCFIVLVLSLLGVIWYLLPPAALGAQAYWCLQFTRSARRWHV
tara:strand:+ start:193 stop:960 length:768 start_codon:yes stop_codon:yes gene_type:complete